MVQRWIVGMLVGLCVPATVEAYMARPNKPVPDAVVSLPSRGPADAVVTIVEAADFQCGYCAKVEPTLQKLQKKYGKKLRLIWLNNPLPFHQNAPMAAVAAMAAHKQGKFWEFHDKLLAGANDLSGENVSKWAKELKLNMEELSKDMFSEPVALRVRNDLDICAALEVAALETGLAVAPGVPYLFPLDRAGPVMVLKSGNFGGPDFYGQVMTTVLGH